MAYAATPLEVRFERYVERGGDDECWGWNGAKAPGGYGVITSGGKHGRMLRASRIAYEAAYGPLAPGMHVCHHCDNPPCTNPRHLFAGTAHDNHLDLVAKGRARGRIGIGEENGRARLTRYQVLTVLDASARGETRAELARRYQVAETTIYAIVTGRNWKGVFAEWGRRQ